MGAGVLPPLLSFLRSGQPQGQAAAVHVLHNLAASAGTQQAVRVRIRANPNPYPVPSNTLTLTHWP